MMMRWPKKVKLDWFFHGWWENVSIEDVIACMCVLGYVMLQVDFLILFNEATQNWQTKGQ